MMRLELGEFRPSETHKKQTHKSEEDNEAYLHQVRLFKCTSLELPSAEVTENAVRIGVVMQILAKFRVMDHLGQVTVLVYEGNK